MVYGHIVVVEDDKEVVGIDGGVVKPFKSQTSCNRSIAYDGDNLAFGFVFFSSVAIAIPSAAEIELEAWPPIKAS